VIQRPPYPWSAIRLAEKWARLRCWGLPIKAEVLIVAVAKTHSEGCFHHDDGRIVVEAGYWEADCYSTILHELAHACQHRNKTPVGHNLRWRALYSEACTEVTGLVLESPLKLNQEELSYSVTSCIGLCLQAGKIDIP
jgi:hypothetical protein